MKNNLNYPRLGLSVSVKVGNAVVRNKEKRVIRETFRQNKNLINDYDIVVIKKRQKSDSFNQKTELLDLLAKINKKK